MGLNRVVPASATMPSITQTHSPSGPNNPPLSSSIKAKYMADLEASMPVHCRSENWEESYQDLSSWCSGTSANSPAICQLPVTDETPVCGLDFQGEIDFDLRKSEEIASIPLEEDCSFNLWGSGSTLLSDGSSPSPPVVADSAVEKSNSVLLKDCWWSEIEEEKVVKELESSRPHTITNLSIKNHVSDDIPSTSVKEEVVDAKENMNPVSVPPPLLSDPVKVAELLSRFERIASMTHPGVNSKAKAVDLMKILQEQIAASNRKKYRGPPAVADLHNYSKVQPEFVAPVLSASAAVVLPEPHQVALTTPNPLSGNSGYIFQSDPFEGLFSMPEDSASINAGVLENGTHQVFPQNLVAAPAFILNTFHPSSVKTVMQIDEGSATLPTNDLFSEAHHEIMREAIKPQQLPSQFPTPHQQPISTQQHSFITSNQSFNISNQASIALPATKLVPTHFGRETGLTIHMPTPRIMPDLDLNFDALLFGTPVGTEGSSKVPAISTPEVLKPLVETPDPESFDLLSYLCDDKVNTPSVTLDNNPFHFSHTNTSNNTTISEHKPNVMVVKPLTPVKVEGEEHLIKSEGSTGAESPVVVELKPQISPKSLSDVEEESFDEDSVPKESSELTVEEQISPRPFRSSRKRKYSDDEFVMSPSPSEENLRPSRRRRTTSSKYDSDEDFTLPVRKTRKKSVTAIWEEEEEDVKPKRPRAGSSGRRRERTISSASESDRYRELRDRNNEASRKSRLTRKAREQELGRQADVLTKENQTLKVKVGEMENLVKKLREALLQSMMKK